MGGINFDSVIFYAFWLLTGTGLLILLLDVRTYALAGMTKERKVSHFLGWFNIVLGIGLIVASWIF